MTLPILLTAGEFEFYGPTSSAGAERRPCPMRGLDTAADNPRTAARRPPTPFESEGER